MRCAVAYNRGDARGACARLDTRHRQRERTIRAVSARGVARYGVSRGERVTPAVFEREGAVRRRLPRPIHRLGVLVLRRDAERIGRHGGRPHLNHGGAHICTCSSTNSACVYGLRGMPRTVEVCAMELGRLQLWFHCAPLTPHSGQVVARK